MQEFVELTFTSEAWVQDGAINCEKYSLADMTTMGVSFYKYSNTAGWKMVKNPCFELKNVSASNIKKIEEGCPVKIRGRKYVVAFASSRLVQMADNPNHYMLMLESWIPGETKEIEEDAKETKKEELKVPEGYISVEEADKIREELRLAQEELASTKAKMEEMTPKKFTVTEEDVSRQASMTVLSNMDVWEYVVGRNNTVPLFYYKLAKFQTYSTNTKLVWKFNLGEKNGPRKAYTGNLVLVMVAVPIREMGEKLDVERVSKLNKIAKLANTSAWFVDPEKRSDVYKGFNPRFFTYLDDGRRHEIFDFEIKNSVNDYGTYLVSGVGNTLFNNESRFQKNAEILEEL